MDFQRESLETRGFQGFISMQRLRDSGCSNVPQRAGNYVVVTPKGIVPDFLSSSVGGRFKQKDPSVTLDVLESNWVRDAELIYIGKANDLRSRIRLLTNFGQGKPVAHWGGRLIWQVMGSAEFLVAWKETENAVDPKTVEAELLSEFKSVYGQRPFANLLG